MGRYLAKRLAQMVLTYFMFLTVVYLLIDAQPGDFGSSFLNDPRLTAEQRQTLREQMGLDKPVLERYVLWLSNVVRGDFGISFSNFPRPVLDVIKERAPRTVSLFLTATVVSFIFGFTAGKLLAWKRGGFLEYAATLGGVGLYTVFTPWFGLMMIVVFAFYLGIFPIGKFIDPVLWRGVPAGISVNFVFWRILLTAFLSSVAFLGWYLYMRRLDPIQRQRRRGIGPLVILAGIVVFWLWLSYSVAVRTEWSGAQPQGLINTLGFLATRGVVRYAADILWHLVLPVLTLSLISFAGQMLLTRNSMLETLREDYILTARAKGLPEKVVRDKYAARNAMLPVVTAFVFSLAFALDGGVITETVFSWPGMGLTLLEAAVRSDIPMAVGALVFTGALVLTAHLIADILYAYLDPRIRYT